MEVLLKIVVETVVLMGFLWIGKSVMKAQVLFKTLVFTALAGAFASQVPFVGSFLSFGVILFFMWKMARVDMVPDGVMIVIIGKGTGLLVMIFAAGVLMRYTDPKAMAMASLNEVPVFVDKDGLNYFAEGEQIYYLDDSGEQVFVEANEIFGITDIMAVAQPTQTSEVPAEAEPMEVVEPEIVRMDEVQSKSPEPSEPDEFSEPCVSDMVVRGEPVPFQVFVPKGWKIYRSIGQLAIRYEDHTYLNCFGTLSASDNKSYLREELQRVFSQYPGYTVARQEAVTIDQMEWGKIQLANSGGDQVLLMTHGGNRGCYTVELNGTFGQLSSQKAVLNRMVNSFHIPPSTFFLAQLDTDK